MNFIQVPIDDTNVVAEISLRALALPGTSLYRWLSIVGGPLDRLLGVDAINAVYQRGDLKGLPPFEFATQGLRALEISVPSACTQLAERVPTEGPLLVVCNHPYGGIEALLLANALGSVRKDVKFLANTALRVFRELEPLLITTNPLKVSQKNLTSIRQCEAHLRGGGALVLFPAGKVSFYQPEKGRISDGDWNRLVGHLARRVEAPLLPIFVRGGNSRLFHVLGRLWDRSKLLLLPRELLKLKGRQISFAVGRAIPASAWRHLDVRTLTRYARVMTYLQESDLEPLGDSLRNDRARDQSQAAHDADRVEPLAPRGDVRRISRELAALPNRQRLLEFKHYSVCFAGAGQIPVLMAEIARERERVFREHDEGSGQARDGDEFDATYTQLFVWDNKKSSLVGAYRLGRTDVLKKRKGFAGLYLSQMFDFDEAFHDDGPIALELGRSFVVPEHQKSFHALYLLWRGIGRYLLVHPQYRRLYGTVSLSRQYDDRAVSMLCDVLIEPTPQIRARHPLTGTLHSELREFFDDTGDLPLETLSAFVRGLDDEGKDLPVLLKHYIKLGAKFLCVGVDPNFNNTPGLLLSLDVPNLAPKALSTFLGDGVEEYLGHRSPGMDLRLHHQPNKRAHG